MIHCMSTSPRNVFNEEDIALFGHRLACVCFCVCVFLCFCVCVFLCFCVCVFLCFCVCVFQRRQNMITYIHLGCSLHGSGKRKYRMDVKLMRRNHWRYISKRTISIFGLTWLQIFRFTTPHHREGFELFLDTIVAMEDVWLVSACSF